ncbi:Transcription factor bhlh [Thalictrum thalictroides]|uniref:Transcription factor bhlh n=1 Tax=Thalictrum thalictroides TaxID=46969 RepID=A0A7J6VS68_THATH|nr:Transcription factor bhlh [Thalictrum thalictroides]
MNSLDEEFDTQEKKVAVAEDSQQSLAASTYPSIVINPMNNKSTFSFTPIETSQTCFESSRNHDVKSHDHWNTSNTMKPSSSSIKKDVFCSSKVLSFGSLESPKCSHKSNGNFIGIKRPKEEIESIGYMTFDLPDVMISQSSRSSQGSTTEHAMAERLRREKLSQHFTALSSIVPGLTKMDKASILGTAIKYLKKLEERARMLEEKTTKRKTESVVFVNKSHKKSNNGWYDETLPEIEARVSTNNVSLRVHCEKHKGVLVNILAEIEKFHLTVVSSSIMPFGNFALEISVTAQMDVEFKMTEKDLVTDLRSAILQFM